MNNKQPPRCTADTWLYELHSDTGPLMRYYAWTTTYDRLCMGRRKTTLDSMYQRAPGHDSEHTFWLGCFSRSHFTALLLSTAFETWHNTWNNPANRLWAFGVVHHLCCDPSKLHNYSSLQSCLIRCCGNLATRHWNTPFLIARGQSSAKQSRLWGVMRMVHGIDNSNEGPALFTLTLFLLR